MLTDAIKQSIDECVLCWLSTVDSQGMPNCSPKEIFAYFNDTIIIANIASPESMNNINNHSSVCVSFVHVFKQKGFKLKGNAKYVDASDKKYQEQIVLLQELAGENFPVKGAFIIDVSQSRPIMAPSYFLVPDATEESLVESAKRTYGF